MSKRRPSGDGMVRKREDGRWEGRIVVGHKQNGEPIFRYVLARTQKELLAKLHRDMDLYQDAQLTEDSRMTLGEYLDRWMEEYGAVTLRPNTLRSYEQYIRCYVKPYLGGKIISRITRLDIQKLKKEGFVSGFWMTKSFQPDMLTADLKSTRKSQSCTLESDIWTLWVPAAAVQSWWKILFLQMEDYWEFWQYQSQMDRPWQ